MTGNIKKLTEKKAPVEYRLPLIPGFTTTSENLTKIIELLKSLSVNKLHLLPYHNMGEAKADKINSKRPKLNLNYLSQKEIDDIISVFNKENINVSLNN
jgi:pyruvate formate lyase activating enzyme